MSTTSENQGERFVYVCSARGCRLRGKVQLMSFRPSAWRFATGSPMRCGWCSEVVSYKGQATEAAVEGRRWHDGDGSSW